MISQSYRYLEIIVVNDGSTDQTRSIARQIAESDLRVRIVDIEHSGTSMAKNVGFSLSKGPIIFFAEGDATYSEDYVLRSVECLRKDPGIGGVCVLGGIWEVRRTFVTRSIDAENQIKHALIHQGKMEPFYAWVFTRDALEKVGLYDTKLSQAEDRDLFARVKNAGFRIGLVEGVHWRHRRFETMWQFLQKSFRKGKKRVHYIVKNNRAKEFAKGIGGLWIPLIFALISVAIPELVWATLSVVIGLVVYFYARVVKQGIESGLNLRQLATLPIYQILRYLSTSIGYTIGILTYPFRPT